MSPSEALVILRQEVASDSTLGKALLIYLADVELQAYRQSERVVDVNVLLQSTGAGKKIHEILKKLAPSES